MEDSNPELEQFRQQWRAEVSARNQNDPNRGAKSKAPRRPPPIASLSSNKIAPPLKGIDEEHIPQVFSGYDGSAEKEEHGKSSTAAVKEPQSALDYYEKAVERESQGVLGDSLNLYRKAFRVGKSACFWNTQLTVSRWITKLIKSTRTSISHLPLLLRNPPTQIHRMLLSQYRIPPTTP